ncbi:MAG: hypothetical protein CMN17_01920 [Roseovarius sp.]|nr:hypothetical protein [Roseovarius sp.]
MRFDPLPPAEPANPRSPRKRRLRAPLARLLRRLGLLRPHDLEALSRRILLPSLPASDEDHARAQHVGLGQRLARQEDWEILARRVAAADRARRRTPGGAPVAGLLAQGARADLLAAARDAIGDGREDGGRAVLDPVLREHPDCYPVALVAALAHMDIAHLWQSRGGAEDRAQMRAQQLRAETLLAPFDAAALDAPALAAAQCALLAEGPAPRPIVAEAHERLIALDPGTPGHMRALGAALLPAQRGSHAEIERAARRCAAATSGHWGAGGYALVWADALARDPAGLGTVDASRFARALRDIAERQPDQHVINRLGAFCALTMAPSRLQLRPGSAAARACARIHACLDWLVSDHLRELHPRFWADALAESGGGTAPAARRARLQRGRQAALYAIATRFAEDLSDGQALAFLPTGMHRLAAVRSGAGSSRTLCRDRT